MDKQPHQMTSTEFSETFPFFTELTPKTKWRCYRICNKVNLQETGEECSYQEFAEFAVEFRWDVEEAMILIDNDHAYFIQEALRHGEDIPSDVLAEYPDMVEEFIAKRIASKRAQQKRQERWTKDKEERAYVKKVSKEDRDFWSNF